jgi:YD repeat-containing protein
MIRNRKLLKFLCVVMILEIFGNAIAPGISWALTSGPTAPEATTFEPVDTTDLVNLQTGDFTYSFPLLEVPGPSGGYPMALSYHAGISPEVDASWVGLGWNLQPGAINRSTSGYADDFNGITGTNWSFWEGGSTTTYTIGINVGYGMGGEVGLEFSDDTYKGYGVGYYAGVYLGMEFGAAELSVNGRVGVTPYGGSYVSAGGGVGISRAFGQISANASLSFTVSSYNGGPAELKGGYHVGLSGTSGNMHASIKMDNYGVSGAVGLRSDGAPKNIKGTSSTFNSKSGFVSTKGYDHSIDIPTPWNFSIHLGKSYHRYWINERQNTSIYGALYFPTDQLAPEDLDTRAYDTYDLTSFSSLVADPKDQLSPDEQNYGSFADYDSYVVTAQGLYGSIKPYHFKTYLYHQNKKEETSGNSYYRVKSNPMGGNSQKPGFRFVGDFSNTYQYTPDFSKEPFVYDNTEIKGMYNTSTGVLAGGNHVEWFTNAEIKNGAPFIECDALGFTRVSDSKIGGFKIINNSGVTYYYALPVYAFNEYRYSGRKDEANKYHFNIVTNLDKYAYTWLLTAVAGPDYVDTNANGRADEGDYGYWVAFDYGLWAREFHWRNPGFGVDKDIDQNFDSFSKGTKQVYYLNAVRTQTHTALFVKDIRYDGKSVVPRLPGAVSVSQNNLEEIDFGGFEPDENDGTPSSVLKLSSIYLFQNEELKTLSGTIESIASKSSFKNGVNYKYSGESVIDVYDIQALGNNVLGKSLKKIDFQTNYDLSPLTDNSYISDDDIENTSNTSSTARLGKLTLNAVQIYGKGGASILPKTSFTYDLDDETFFGNVLRSSSGEVTITTNEALVRGDILNQGSSYCYVTAINGRAVTVKEIRGTVQTGFFEKTKNPPYQRDFRDIWGTYKVDYDPSENTYVSRMTTSLSSRSADVWSLRKIKTALGSTITVDYESDKYHSAIRHLSQTPIKSIEKIDGNTSKVTLYEDVTEFGLKPGDLVNFYLYTYQKYNIPPLQTQREFDCNGNNFRELIKWRTITPDNTLPMPILAVDKNTFNIQYTVPSYDNPSQCYLINPPYSAEDCSNSPRETRVVAQEPVVLAGALVFDNNLFSPYGGGIRVTALHLKSGSTISTTSYEYSNGITTYEPVGMSIPSVRLPGINPCLQAEEQKALNAFREKYFPVIYQKFLNLFANSRELPGPEVLYQNVKVKEQIEQKGVQAEIPGYSSYEFEVFSPDLVAGVPENSSNKLPISYIAGRTLNANSQSVKNVVILEDYTALYGSLKRNALHDRDGNKITETVHHYLHENIPVADYKKALSKYQYQGLITETFADRRDVLDRSTISSSQKKYVTYTIFGQKIKYPAISLGETSINYKTGIKTTSTNLAFDFYSGQPTRTTTVDGFGNTYVTNLIPAYEKYPAMGPASGGGRNMLTQTTASTLYKVDAAGNNIGLVSSSADTWSDQVPVLKPGQGNSSARAQQGIWRKRANFTFIGDDAEPLRADGLYDAAKVIEFNAWGDHDPIPDKWQKNSEITLYDIYSHAMEAFDINNHYAATKFSFDHTKVLATATNASYSELAYTGAEEPPQADEFGNASFGGGVICSGTWSDEKYHTGSHAVKANAGQRAITFSLVPSQRIYRVSFWSTSNTPVVKAQFDNAAAQTVSVKTIGKAGDWYLCEGTINVLDSWDRLLLWCEASANSTYFDDFRFFPLTSSVVSYVYNAYGELSHILDANNLFTEYRYDAMGRLIETWRESFDGKVSTGTSLVSKVNYHFAEPFYIDIQSSRIGTVGSIEPSGVQQVQQGGDIEFRAVETCPVPRFVTMYVDGIPLTNGSAVTLIDGTMVEVEQAVVRLKNVQSSHEVKAEFMGNVVPGQVVCKSVTNGSQICYTGGYEYAFNDACGQLGGWRTASSASDVPASLQPYIRTTDCCSLNPRNSNPSQVGQPICACTNQPR